jgi:hypothetical protein
MQRRRNHFRIVNGGMAPSTDPYRTTNAVNAFVTLQYEA